MAVRTPPVQIYTSTLARRDRAWSRGRDRGRGRRRRRRVRALDFAALGLSLLVVAAVVAAVLAPAAA